MPKKPKYLEKNKICTWNEGVECDNKQNCKNCVWCHVNEVAEDRLKKIKKVLNAV